MGKNEGEDLPVIDVLTQIEAARKQGALIHDMQDPKKFPGVTAFLAEHGIFTTCELQRPEKFKKFRRRMGAIRQLGVLAANATEALKNANIEVFDAAIQNQNLGSLLVNLFEDVDIQSIEGLHIAGSKPNKASGIVTAKSTTFTVSSPEKQELLSDLFQIWGRTDAKLPHLVRLGFAEGIGLPTVAVSNLNEYSIRMVEHAISEIVAIEDFKRTKTKLPLDRKPLRVWKGEGATFHPMPEARMVVVNQQYKRMCGRVAITYTEGTPHTSIEEEMQNKPDTLGSSPSAALEVFRKGVNTVIRAWRESGQHNQDQNPNKNERLRIERGVNVRRTPGSLGEAGPPRIRALTAVEELKQKGQDYIQHKKKHPVAAVAKGIATAVGAGLESLIDIAAEILPMVRNSPLVKDWRAWRRQERDAIEAGKKLDDLITSLQRKQDPS